MFGEEFMGELLWSNGRGLIDEDCVWFVPANYNCLCKYDYCAEKMRKFIFLDDATTMRDTHYNLMKYKNYIVLIPIRDMNILIYNIENGKIERLRLAGEENRKEKFIASAVLGNYIYMFPVLYPQILRLNMENRYLEYIDSPNAKKSFIDGVDYTQTCVATGTMANLLLIDSNKICEFDMETCSERIVAVGNEGVRYQTICKYEEDGLILSDQYGKIIILDKNKKQIVCINPEVEECFVNCVPVRNGYLFMPYRKTVDCVYLEEKNVSKVDLGIEIKAAERMKEWKYTICSLAYYDEEKVTFFNRINRSFCILDRKTCVTQEYYISLEALDEDIIKKIYGKFGAKEVLAEQETETLGLGSFLKYAEKIHPVQKQLNAVGEKIYQASLI